jgi:intergrase/recombinase
MKNEPQIVIADSREPQMVLPSEDVRKFLLEAIDHLNFPGKMVEFVVGVKQQIATAKIAE